MRASINIEQGDDLNVVYDPGCRTVWCHVANCKGLIAFISPEAARRFCQAVLDSLKEDGRQGREGRESRSGVVR